jgi:hypothetical protein
MKKIFLICEWITESTPTLLAAFGESAIEQLKMLAEKPVAADLETTAAAYSQGHLQGH